MGRVAFLLVAFTVSVSTAADLTRPVAATLISSHPTFTYVPAETVTEGRQCADAPRPGEPTTNAASYQQLQSLKNAGYLTVRAVDPKEFGTVQNAWDAMGSCLNWVTVALTAKAISPDVAAFWKPASTVKGQYFLTLYQRKLIAVTGLAKNPDGTVNADFTWSFDPTPLGQAIGTLTSPMDSVAVFKLYDDGWRLMTLGIRTPEETAAAKAAKEPKGSQVAVELGLAVKGTDIRACTTESSARSSTSAAANYSITNAGTTKVVVYWLDYDGHRQRWFDLEVGTTQLKVETYTGHPWLVADVAGRCLGIFYAPNNITTVR